MEIKTHWTYAIRRLNDDGTSYKDDTHMVTAVCFNEHWYAGKEDDLLDKQPVEDEEEERDAPSGSGGPEPYDQEEDGGRWL